VKSYIGKCPVQSGGSFDFNVPKETKSGEVIFAWSWFNRVGNREMYMNCAVVTIANGGSGLSNYPDIFVANLDDSCGTDEGFDVDFPNPGTPDRVVNLSTRSHLPHGACALPKLPPTGTVVQTSLGDELKTKTPVVKTLDLPPTSAPSTTTTTTTITYTLTKTSLTTTLPTPTQEPGPKKPHCECRCVEPGQNSGYVVNISPFTY